MIALAVAAAMWVAMMFAVATALVAPMIAFDDDSRTRESNAVFVMACIAAVALFFGSGPVAYWIARRRWLLALPLICLAAWGIGVAIAYAT